MSFESNSLYPNRAFSSRKGAFDMFSIPPATKACPFPASIASAASMTAFNPEPQTLFTVSAGTSGGRPP